jgi:hypothetical protein
MEALYWLKSQRKQYFRINYNFITNSLNNVILYRQVTNFEDKGEGIWYDASSFAGRVINGAC